VDAGLVVQEYGDDASGVMIEEPGGSGQFESVPLHPHRKLSPASNEEVARRLHDVAAEKVLIARSTAFKIRLEATFETASP
jgi:organic hydroperoxide reductase OsmC/OhrA